MCRGYLSRIKSPNILEIGTDRGQTTLPLLHRLIYQHGERGRGDGFRYIGVDIKLRDELLSAIEQFCELYCVNHQAAGKILANPSLTKQQSIILAHHEAQRELNQVMFYTCNSLEWLKDPDRGNDKFDLILLDGDHNYFTVSQELVLLEKFMKPHSIVVLDDFNGRWSTRDMWYAKKDDYKSNKIATQPPTQSTEKEGVQNAVLDFITQANQPYSLLIPNQQSEPAILYRNDILTLDWEVRTGGWASCNLLVSNPNSKNS